jgi:hypothetical protein
MAASTSLSRRLFGSDQQAPASESLNCGAVRFEVAGAQVHGLYLDGLEVVRGAGLVVRDAWWGSHALVERERETHAADEHWRRRVTGVVLDAQGREALDWQVRLHIQASGLRLEVCLRARQAFVTCRSGLMVLHPLRGVVGLPVRVIHVDGREQQGRFPDAISPAQPFFDIGALVYQPTPGLRLQWSFSGDVFEMEDQRNWSDASFKTYNRPLAWPCPYRLEAGEDVVQSLRLDFEPLESAT